ncbi:MAG TPA: hypothetical protein VMU59_14710 [Caulobacteraceae bacterium]|nr:hypothetical protein [Caulobacteraceae bacterium]
MGEERLEPQRSLGEKSVERGLVFAALVTVVSGARIIRDIAQGAKIADFFKPETPPHTIAMVFVGALG